MHSWHAHRSLPPLLQMAMGQPPHADLHPMRVLFLIPKEPPPHLSDHFSQPFHSFIAACLQKVGLPVAWRPNVASVSSGRQLCLAQPKTLCHPCDCYCGLLWPAKMWKPPALSVSGYLPSAGRQAAMPMSGSISKACRLELQWCSCQWCSWPPMLALASPSAGSNLCHVRCLSLL